MFEQGVFSDLGNYPSGGGPQQMKMVGLSPGWGGGYAEGDPSQYGLQLGGGGGGVFEGKGGLAQCAVRGDTGEYMVDKTGQAKCWYLPTTSGTNFVGGSGGLGTWINPDSDIVHNYGTKRPPTWFKFSVPMLRNAPFLASTARPHWMRFPAFKFKSPTVANMFVYGSIISLAVAVAFFVWRLSINKRMQEGKGPGILAKLFHWDTWNLWGNKYPKGEDKVFGAFDPTEDYVDNDAINPKPTEEQAPAETFPSNQS